MASIGRSDNISLSVAEKVKGLAQKMNTEIRETNEADLFNDELYLNPTIMKEVNPNILNSLKIKKRTSELN